MMAHLRSRNSSPRYRLSFANSRSSAFHLPFCQASHSLDSRFRDPSRPLHVGSFVFDAVNNPIPKFGAMRCPFHACTHSRNNLVDYVVRFLGAGQIGRHSYAKQTDTGHPNTAC